MNTLIENTVTEDYASVEVQERAGLVTIKHITYSYEVTRHGIEGLEVYWEEGEDLEDENLYNQLETALYYREEEEIERLEEEYRDDDGRKSDDGYESRNDK